MKNDEDPLGVAESVVVATLGRPSLSFSFSFPLTPSPFFSLFILNEIFDAFFTIVGRFAFDAPESVCCSCVPAVTLVASFVAATEDRSIDGR